MRINKSLAAGLVALGAVASAGLAGAGQAQAYDGTLNGVRVITPTKRCMNNLFVNATGRPGAWIALDVVNPNTGRWERAGGFPFWKGANQAVRRNYYPANSRGTTIYTVSVTIGKNTQFSRIQTADPGC